ncbi:MAG TPA: hypothetical protein PLA90_17020 [Candidatus Sumerlaeota bacterium]|nr:hypothetical protein [Candidatus Sumerlaeota bacterium]
MGRRQIKKGFLDVWGEEAQVHDLGDAGASDMAKAGDLGHVLYLATIENPLEMNGERHEARETRNAPLLRT